MEFVDFFLKFHFNTYCAWSAFPR